MDAPTIAISTPTKSLPLSAQGTHRMPKLLNVQNETAVISLAEIKERKAFLKALNILFKTVCKQGHPICAMDLTPYLYASIQLPNNVPSGEECAKRLLSGIVDRAYTLPSDEVSFIKKNADSIKEYFENIRSHRPITMVSLGCGPQSPSVELKDIPLARAIGATRYVAVDINDQYAQHAAKVTAYTLRGVQTESITTDFTRSLDLNRYTQDSTVVLTMLGDTIGQFPLTENAKKANFTGTGLKKLMLNLGKATNFNAIMLASTDAEACEDSVEFKYHGEGMISLMKTLWRTAKEVTGDQNFNPAAFYYTAKFDPELSAIQFIHTADEPTSININGKKYNIAQGTKFIIGYSQKTTPEKIMPDCLAAGWETLPLGGQLNYVNTVRLLTLRGKNCAL